MNPCWLNDIIAVLKKNCYFRKHKFGFVKKILFLFLLGLSINSHAQLQNGSIAPDFTLTDYYGTERNLYSYLNAGKTVFLEIFAAHCPTCWGYHQTHTLKNLYNNYGPGASNDLMVLALEHDQWNDSNAFVGNGPVWVTQGNWLNDTPYPIFNVEDPYRGVFSDYNVTFYPVVYKICPNKIVERVYTSETVAQLYQKVQDCQMALSLTEQDQSALFNFNINDKKISFKNDKVKQFRIYNLQGQVVKSVGVGVNSTFDLEDLNSGVYILEIETKSGIFHQKRFIPLTSNQ